MTKYERARALLDGWLSANVGKAPGNPQYLAHLIWQRAKKDRAFRYALVRWACRHLAVTALTNEQSPYL